MWYLTPLRKISWNLESAKFLFIIVQSFWNLTCLAAETPVKFQSDPHPLGYTLVKRLLCGLYFNVGNVGDIRYVSYSQTQWLTCRRHFQMHFYREFLYFIHIFLNLEPKRSSWQWINIGSRNSLVLRQANSWNNDDPGRWRIKESAAFNGSSLYRIKSVQPGCFNVNLAECKKVVKYFMTINYCPNLS